MVLGRNTIITFHTNLFFETVGKKRQDPKTSDKIRTMEHRFLNDLRPYSSLPSSPSSCAFRFCPATSLPFSASNSAGTLR